MFVNFSSLALLIAIVFGAVFNSAPDLLAQESDLVRFATLNISFNRKEEGELKEELAAAETTKQIAEIIQRVCPDVIVLNEFDYDPASEGVTSFLDKHLGVSQNQEKPIHYEHAYSQSVNTGVDSKMDLDSDGKNRLQPMRLGTVCSPANTEWLCYPSTQSIKKRENVSELSMERHAKFALANRPWYR